jgi:hypothetical protein
MHDWVAVASEGLAAIFRSAEEEASDCGLENPPMRAMTVK